MKNISNKDKEHETVQEENYRPISTMNTDIAKPETAIIFKIKPHMQTHR